MKSLVEFISQLSEKRLLTYFFIISLLFKLLFIATNGTNFRPLYEHGELADNLFKAGEFKMHWAAYKPINAERIQALTKPPPYLSAWQPPFATFQIYTAYVLFGQTNMALFAMLIINAILGSFIIIVSYKLTYELFKNRWIALWSGLIIGFYPYYFVSILSFTGSSYYQFFLIVYLLFALRSLQNDTWKYWLLFAVCGALMIYLRSEFYLFNLLFVAVLGNYHIKKNKFTLKALLKPLVTIVVLYALYSPWYIRNYVVFDKSVPVVSRAWHEAWRGNNPTATGGPFNDNGEEIWINRKTYAYITKKMDDFQLDQRFELRVDSMFKSEVLTFARENPFKVFQLGLKKILLLWSFDPLYAPSRSIGYVLIIIPISIFTLIGIYVGGKNLLAKKENEVFAMFFTYGLFYHVIFAGTFILPRYQIFFFTGLVPFTAFGIVSLLNFLFKKLKIN
jgi:hypothetical protein